MKKVLFIGLVVAGASIMTSCKKDYTCACTATDDFWNISYTLNDYKKKDAESVCDTWNSSGAGVDGWKCELK